MSCSLARHGQECPGNRPQCLSQLERPLSFDRVLVFIDADNIVQLQNWMLATACQRGHLEVVKLLVYTYSVDPDNYAVRKNEFPVLVRLPLYAAMKAGKWLFLSLFSFILVHFNRSRKERLASIPLPTRVERGRMKDSECWLSFQGASGHIPNLLIFQRKFPSVLLPPCRSFTARPKEVF